MLGSETERKLAQPNSQGQLEDTSRFMLVVCSSSLGLTRKESRVGVGLDLLIHHPWSQCLGAQGPRGSRLPEISLCLVLPALIFSVCMVPQGHQLALVISSCLSGCLSHFPGSPTLFFIRDHSLHQFPGRNRTKAQGSSLLSSQLGDVKRSRTLGADALPASLSVGHLYRCRRGNSLDPY